MSDKNIEMMKKLIEEKKNKGKVNGGTLHPTKSMGKTQKAFKNKKQGGVTDK
ncbi:MAG: hypothetical protein RR891_11350 [Clostridium sp.]|uniref:hypothetical protein n=1 Tax=Clostridium sp. TaxID=1506 RepID=UPI00302876B3